MFGNEPARWSDSLAGDARLRFTLNTLTRIRFVADDGTLEFADQGRRRRRAARASGPGSTRPAGARAGVPIAFGHWSSLGLVDRHDLLGLDTGCVWGGRLTAVRIDGGGREVIQVGCDPGRRRQGGGRCRPRSSVVGEAAVAEGARAKISARGRRNAARRETWPSGLRQQS